MVRPRGWAHHLAGRGNEKQSGIRASDCSDGTWHSRRFAEHRLPVPARGKDSLFNGSSTYKTDLDSEAKIPHWTLHDLRRTFSTRLARLGVPPHIKEMILAHASAKDPVEAIYDLRTYELEMRADLEKWEHHLTALPSRSEKPDNRRLCRPVMAGIGPAITDGSLRHGQIGREDRGRSGRAARRLTHHSRAAPGR
jgi:hypothetical protein